MSSNIILNRTHITNSSNSRLTYHFPSSVEFEEGDTLAVSHLSLYYSWFNITAENNNNKFYYKWWDMSGNLTVLEEVVIADGYYNIEALYEYLQRHMVSKGHYLETLDGNNYMYMIDLMTNSTYYSVVVRLNSISEQYDGGLGLSPTTDFFRNPTTWKLPVNFETPEFIIPSNNNFGKLLGFSPKTLSVDLSNPIPNIQGKYDFSNDIVPQIEPSSSFIITCNLINNEFTNPNNVLYAFTLSQSSFGSQINPKNDVVYSKIKKGKYNTIDLVIYDQNFKEMKIKDPEMLIVLSILKKQ